MQQTIQLIDLLQHFHEKVSTLKILVLKLVEFKLFCPFYMMKIDFKSGVQGAPTAPFQKLGVKWGAMRPWGRHLASMICYFNILKS